MVHTLPPIVTSTFLIAAMAPLLVHWVRRTVWKPSALTITWSAPLRKGRSSSVFDRVQRLFHWVMTSALVLLIVTGLALYSPSLFDPVSMAISSFPIHSNILFLVDVHVAAATAFTLLLVLHVAWDLRRPGAGSLIRSRISDLAEVSFRARGFIVGIRSIEKKEKYDALMKGFHTFLVVAAVGLAATGAVQFFVAPWWNYPQLFHTAIEPWWRPTWIHDALGFSLLALTVAHTYFALLRVNRPILRAMIIGEFREGPTESSTQPPS